MREQTVKSGFRLSRVFLLVYFVQFDAIFVLRFNLIRLRVSVPSADSDFTALAVRMRMYSWLLKHAVCKLRNHASSRLCLAVKNRLVRWTPSTSQQSAYKESPPEAAITVRPKMIKLHKHIASALFIEVEQKRSNNNNVIIVERPLTACTHRGKRTNLVT